MSEVQRQGKGAGDAHPGRVEITAALHAEAQTMEELGRVLRAQRDAVASADPEAVQAATERVEHTLAAADEHRRRRRSLLGPPPPDGHDLDTLDARFGPDPGLEEARRRLRRAAEAAAHEAAVNATVLRRALETGQAFLRTLVSALEEGAGTYAPPRPATAGKSSVLVNKVA